MQSSMTCKRMRFVYARTTLDQSRICERSSDVKLLWLLCTENKQTKNKCRTARLMISNLCLTKEHVRWFPRVPTSFQPESTKEIAMHQTRRQEKQLRLNVPTSSLNTDTTALSLTLQSNPLKLMSTFSNTVTGIRQLESMFRITVIATTIEGLFSQRVEADT